MEVNSAKSWRSAPGVVIRSDVQTRNVKVMSDIKRVDGGGTEARNFANVVYEYELFGKKLRNNRVSIGEDLGNFEVDETLARYPVGTKVTVYYNPRNLKEAVLERDAPKGMWGCITTGVLGLAAAYLIAMFGFGKLYDALTSFWSPANATRVLFFSIFGLFIAMILETVRRGLAAAQSWPVVPGRIEKSEVEQFQGYVSNDKGGSSTVKTFYKSVLLYSYTVNSRTYTGSNIGLKGTMTASWEGPARRAAERYKVGQAVDVHYDPKKPTETALETGYPLWFWFSWIIPGCAFAAAIYFGTR
jgi:hypothetical protein